MRGQVLMVAEGEALSRISRSAIILDLFTLQSRSANRLLTCSSELLFLPSVRIAS